MASKIKSLLTALFNSPYLDKADIALVVAAAVVLFKLPLDAGQQAAAVTVLGAFYIVAHKLTNS